MKNLQDILVSQFSLAGEIIKLKYKQGVNISLYFSGTQGQEKGLIKIQDLFYRGDNIVSTRSSRTFYSLTGDAVIIDAARGKIPVFKDVTTNPINSGLSWVYACPMLDYHNQVIAVICLSGSVQNLDDEFQKDLFVLVTNLAKNLTLIFEEANIPDLWKDSLLTL